MHKMQVKNYSFRIIEKHLIKKIYDFKGLYIKLRWHNICIIRQGDIISMVVSWRRKIKNYGDGFYD
jgi:hypothetical protein